MQQDAPECRPGLPECAVSLSDTGKPKRLSRQAEGFRAQRWEGKEPKVSFAKWRFESMVPPTALMRMIF